jgi:hypothetical protein
MRKINFLFTKAKSTARTTAAFQLPFFEDFYQPEIFPNPTLRGKIISCI